MTTRTKGRLLAGLSVLVSAFIVWMALREPPVPEPVRAADILSRIPLKRPIMAAELAQALYRATGKDYRAGMIDAERIEVQLIVPTPHGPQPQGMMTFVFRSEPVMRAPLNFLDLSDTSWRDVGQAWRRVQ